MKNIILNFIGYFLYLNFKSYPFSQFPPENHLSNPPPPVSMGVSPTLPTHSCLPTLTFSYTGVSSLHRTKGLSSLFVQQGHPLLHMLLEPWSLHVYSLVGGLIPGTRGGGVSSWCLLLFFLWGCKPIQLLQSFL